MRRFSTKVSKSLQSLTKHVVGHGTTPHAALQQHSTRKRDAADSSETDFLSHFAAFTSLEAYVDGTTVQCGTKVPNDREEP